jgi:hypothetical protein
VSLKTAGKSYFFSSEGIPRASIFHIPFSFIKKKGMTYMPFDIG